MTTYDEKILQLLDRIHTTAQSRREKTIDGAVQTMERVNKTSYGALRDLTENGHKKARPPRTQAWQASPTQDLLAVGDEPAGASRAMQTAAMQAPLVAQQPVTGPAQSDAADGAGSPFEATEVHARLLPEEPTPNEETAVMHPPSGPESAFDAPRPPPEGVVSGSGANYGGSTFQETQVIWYRRLFRRR